MAANLNAAAVARPLWDQPVSSATCVIACHGRMSALGQKRSFVARRPYFSVAPRSCRDTSLNDAGTLHRAVCRRPFRSNAMIRSFLMLLAELGWRWLLIRVGGEDESSSFVPAILSSVALAAMIELSVTGNGVPGRWRSVGSD